LEKTWAALVGREKRRGTGVPPALFGNRKRVPKLALGILLHSEKGKKKAHTSPQNLFPVQIEETPDELETPKKWGKGTRASGQKGISFLANGKEGGLWTFAYRRGKRERKTEMPYERELEDKEEKKKPLVSQKKSRSELKWRSFDPGSGEGKRKEEETGRFGWPRPGKKKRRGPREVGHGRGRGKCWQGPSTRNRQEKREEKSHGGKLKKKPDWRPLPSKEALRKKKKPASPKKKRGPSTVMKEKGVCR